MQAQEATPTAARCRVAPPCGVPGAAALALTLALALLALGCHKSSSPTAPVAEPPPAVTIEFVGTGSLADLEPTIRTLIQDTFDQAAGALDVERLRFVVSADTARSIPGWGLGGYTLGPTEIDIVIDPSFPGLESVLASRLPTVVAHEIHHTVRWRSPGPYGTLLDALVFEGMADHFAVQLLGADIPPWSEVLSQDDIDRYLAQAGPQLDNAGFDFGAWFLGTREYPRWTGYSLGYFLVGDYLARHPQHTAASLVHEPPETFRPD